MSALKITFGSVTDRGLNPRRAANEDRLLALPDAGLFLVADGVGGRRAGQVASQTVVDVFTEAFAPKGALGRREGGRRELIEQAVARANRAIYAQSRELA
jgi:serine/threonine protein phosphatase PrpC